MTQYEKDCQVTIGTGNGKYISKGQWNLILSKRDVSLFCKGMTINRHWRLKHVKDYFGLKGKKESILKQLKEMLEKSEKEALHIESAKEWWDSFPEETQKEIVKEFVFDPPLEGEPKLEHIVAMYKMVFEIEKS